MRIDPETFLVLTLLLGTGAAVGVAVVTSRADESEVVDEEPAENVAQAPATETPDTPEPAPPVTPATPPTVTPAAGTTAAEEPWVDPFPIIPDDPNAVPGPDVEGF